MGFLRDSSRRRWDRASAIEPYYAVLSQPRFFLTNVRENPAPFFETGEADVDKFIGTIRALDRDVRLHEVLEFGCGPGRLLPAFLRRGMKVTAVDQSPRMLALAAESVATLGGSIEFIDATAFFVEKDARFDLLTAAHVLQHVPAADGAELVRYLATHCVAKQVAWFEQVGSSVARRRIDVE